MDAECGTERWVTYDTRTGQKVSIVVYFTEEQAWDAITSWRDRDIRGKRQDIHDMMPYLSVRKKTDEDW